MQVTLKEQWVWMRMFVFKLLVRCADLVGAHSTLVVLFRIFISEIEQDGSLKKVTKNVDRSKITVLALNRTHYPRAIEVLASEPNVRCLDVSWEFLRYFLASFVREPSNQEKSASEFGVRSDFRMASSGTEICRGREKYRQFLRKFLPLFLNRYGIDIVFNSDERFRREADFSRIASESGFPHICYTRESMFIIPGTFTNASRRHKNLGRFWGDHIVVQNDATRKVLLHAGYARDEQITVVGSIKMDRFIRRIKSNTGSQSSKKMVLLFTWTQDRQTVDGEIIGLEYAMKAAVRAMVRVAVKQPNVDFVVKLKDRHVKTNQLQPLMNMLHSLSGNANGLPNFRFCGDEVAGEDLIFDSTVVCTMQSTTVLEAAVAGKPIILPHFPDLRNHPKSQDVLMYGDQRHLFDVPNDEDEIERLITWRLEDNHIPEDIQRERLELFNDHVAPLTADATDKFIQLLFEYAWKGRKKRTRK